VDIEPQQNILTCLTPQSVSESYFKLAYVEAIPSTCNVLKLLIGFIGSFEWQTKSFLDIILVCLFICLLIYKLNNEIVLCVQELIFHNGATV